MGGVLSQRCALSVKQGWSSEPWEKTVLYSGLYPSSKSKPSGSAQGLPGAVGHVGEITPEPQGVPLFPSNSWALLSAHPQNTVPHTLICSSGAVIYRLSVPSAEAPPPSQTHKLHICVVCLRVVTPCRVCLS